LWFLKNACGETDAETDMLRYFGSTAKLSGHFGEVSCYRSVLVPKCSTTFSFATSWNLFISRPTIE